MRAPRARDARSALLFAQSRAAHGVCTRLAARDTQAWRVKQRRAHHQHRPWAHRPHRRAHQQLHRAHHRLHSYRYRRRLRRRRPVRLRSNRSRRHPLLAVLQQRRAARPRARAALACTRCARTSADLIVANFVPTSSEEYDNGVTERTTRFTAAPVSIAAASRFGGDRETGTGSSTVEAAAAAMVRRVSAPPSAPFVLRGG